jgi:hypothetical protein
MRSNVFLNALGVKAKDPKHQKKMEDEQIEIRQSSFIDFKTA